MHETYVDSKGLDYGLPDGTVAHLYGGLAFRYWVGTPGESELVAGKVQFWEPVRSEDWEQFVEELKLQARSRVALSYGQKTGLQMEWSNRDLDRIEWLVIDHAEPDTVDRLHAFEGGWSAARPPGVPADKLTAELIGRMVRRSGLTRRGR